MARPPDSASSTARTLGRSGPVILALGAALLGVLLLAVPRLGPESPFLPTSALPSALPTALPSASAEATVLLATGDIGNCEGSHDEDVAALAAALPGTIALLGDIAYPNGSTADFKNCFAPAWSPLLARIRPAPGNHDYQTPHAAPYFAFFGVAAGPAGAGWYSYDLGSWHIVVLNSNCDAIGGCGADSVQLAWLKVDLAAAGTSRPGACTLAYWHHPRYSSGLHGDDPMTQPLWAALAAAGADVVLSGHDHDYERFQPIDGIKSFIVGTGGRSLYPLSRPADPASELRRNDSYGLLMLTLRDGAYDWRFVPAPGSNLTDAGTGQCR